MKKLNQWLLVSLGSAAIVGSTVAFAAPASAPENEPAAVSVNAVEPASEKPVKEAPPKTRDGYLEQQLSQLDLTAEQAAQIDQLLSESKLAQQALNQEMRENFDELRAMTESDEYDPAKVQIIAQMIGKNSEERVILRTETKHALTEILTEEQRAKLKDTVKADIKKGFGGRQCATV